MCWRTTLPSIIIWLVAFLEPEIAEYYQRGGETSRLESDACGPLELVRTQELILRHLPPGPLDIVDVGGGPGVYAEWLAGFGHRVRLVDPVDLHVDQARRRHSGVTAVIGDARALVEPDRSFDVVLLLGPLYHLVERADRLLALSEALRVLRAHGMLFVAAISRYAAFLDLLVRLDRLHEATVSARVCEALNTGVFRGHYDGLFTTAYFHHAHDLADEVSSAGFEQPTVYNIEGPGFLVSNFAERWADPQRRETIVDAARRVERDESMMGAANHLLAVAHAPSDGP